MGLRLITLISALAIVLVSCEEENPATNNPNYKPRSGKVIFTKLCVQCHGDNGKLCSSGAKDLSRSKMDSTGIVEIIKNGKNGMPRQGKKIYTDDEMSNVVDFVKSLRK